MGNAHAASLGISAAMPGDFLTPEVRALCNANAPTGEWTQVNGIELPSPFTRIADREPVVGDCIVTRDNIGEWMSNSHGSVFAVQEDVRLAYVLLSNDWARVSF